MHSECTFGYTCQSERSFRFHSVLIPVCCSSAIWHIELVLGSQVIAVSSSSLCLSNNNSTEDIINEPAPLNLICPNILALDQAFAKAYSFSLWDKLSLSTVCPADILKRTWREEYSIYTDIFICCRNAPTCLPCWKILILIFDTDSKFTYIRSSGWTGSDRSNACICLTCIRVVKAALPSKREDTKKTAISLTYVALRNIVVDNINHLNVNSV